LAGLSKKIIFVVFGSLLLVSCTTSTVVRLTNNLPQYKKDHRKIAVFLGAPDKRSRPLGLVAVARDGENATWAVEVLKMEAAELGADAIANLEMNYTTGFFPTLRLQALAVKYE
jgi:hypothetical protein